MQTKQKERFTVPLESELRIKRMTTFVRDFSAHLTILEKKLLATELENLISEVRA